MVHELTDRKINSFTVTLRDESRLIIREAVLQDAAGLIRCVKNYVNEGDYMVMEADEFAPDIRQGREFINSFIEDEHSLLLVATHNDEIVGNLDITGGKRKRLRHTGLVGMGILQEYRSKGLGKALVAAGLRWAKEHTQLEKLWLQVLAGNDAAIRLYTSFGFSEEGRQSRFVKDASGRYYDNLLFGLDLSIR